MWWCKEDGGDANCKLDKKLAKTHVAALCSFEYYQCIQTLM